MSPDAVLTVLDENRASLVRAVDGLTDAQSRKQLVPSLTAPITLLKHCAAAERIWFQRTVAGLGPDECDGYATGDDASWHVADEESLNDVVAEYQAAVTRSRAIVASLAPPTDATFTHYRRGPVSFGWICVHMVEETARHAGHMDILVEQLRANEL